MSRSNHPPRKARFARPKATGAASRTPGLDAEFKPFLKGPAHTPASMRDRLRNPVGARHRQQQLLIRTARELQISQQPITLSALREASRHGLMLMDLVPTRLEEAAHAVRQAAPLLAEELLRLAGRLPDKPAPAQDAPALASTGATHLRTAPRA